MQRSTLPAELLAYINTSHSTTFHLFERYSAGEQGAFAIMDKHGMRYVLKWQLGMRNLDRMLQAKAVTDRLRIVGYPASHFLFIGCALEGVYSIQAALPGAPNHPLTIALIPRLLALSELQIEQAMPNQRSWHDEVVRTVLVGGEGYCLHTSLQEHSHETAQLLRELQRLVSIYQREPHRTQDIVHTNFQPANILVHDNQVSGIIDWDAPYAGDHIFDIATLLFYTYDDVEVRALLWRYALAHVSLNLLRLYFAHLILRQVDWSLRYHNEATSKRYIVRSHALLTEIAQRSRETPYEH